jgi:hypothetical protein
MAIIDNILATFSTFFRNLLEAALMQQNTAVAARVAQLEAGATRATAVAGR